MRFKSISIRVFALFVPTIVLMFVAFSVVNYRAVDREINATFDERMHVSLRAAELEVRLELYRNAAVAINLANYAHSLEWRTFDHGRNKRMLDEIMNVNENTVGGGIWFDPYKFDARSYYFGTYLFYDTSGNVFYQPDYGAHVDYFNEDWYLKGMVSKGEPMWSTVYYDPVSAVTMVTASVPFFDEENDFIGMGTADMNIVNIRRIINGTTVGKTGQTFIVGAAGEYITSLGERKGAAASILKDGDAALARLGKEMFENRDGMTELIRNGVTYKVYYSTINGVGWKVAVLVDVREIKSSAISAFAFTTFIPALGILLIIAGIFLFVSYLHKIISKVNYVADMAASGDFSKRVEVTEADEFGFMEQRLNTMIASLDDMNKQSEELLRDTEKANRSKSEFLSRMSHEIRSPMNAIIGMTQIARSTNDQCRISDCLAKIDTASKHLLALINDVLDMSKIEANKFELIYDEFSPRKMMKRIYDMMNVKAEEKSQKLTLVIDDSVPECVIGDELRFSQVITNLVSNAIKFTGEKGHIDVDMSGIEENDNSNVIMVDVQDSGIGLTQEQIQKLFKPFEQADGSVSRKYGGTGLGLAITKRIVEMMNGKIWVESEAGKGSIFTFTAKVKKCRENACAQNMSDRVSIRAMQVKDMRILVADDSKESGEYMTHTLNSMGFNCDLARDGDEVVNLVVKAMAENRPYDTIFMDYAMPKMNGIETAKKIRELTGANTSIVMISIADWKTIERNAREAGVAKCVSKPVSPSTMLDSISEAVPCVIKNDGDVVTPYSVGFEGHTILLAEDVEINREIVTAYLEETKLGIDYAVNGAEAVKKFNEDPGKYDVILMDIQMPEMDGFEATRRIRASDAKNAKTIPIVAMTANALSEDVQRCRDAGMNDHIAKPIDPEVLLLKLNDYFFMKRYLGKDIW